MISRAVTYFALGYALLYRDARWAAVAPQLICAADQRQLLSVLSLVSLCVQNLQNIMPIVTGCQPCWRLMTCWHGQDMMHCTDAPAWKMLKLVAYPQPAASYHSVQEWLAAGVPYLVSMQII